MPKTIDKCFQDVSSMIFTLYIQVSKLIQIWGLLYPTSLPIDRGFHPWVEMASPVKESIAGWYPET